MSGAEIQRLHGRDEELRTLRLLIESAARGEGGAAVAIGERGSGRTSIAAHAVASAASGFTVPRSAGSPGETDIPGACLHRLLRPLRAAISRLPPHHADTLRALADGRPRHPLTPADRHPHGPLALPAALLELFCLLSPTVCVIDDVDRADVESRPALGFVARHPFPRRSGPAHDLAAAW